MFSTKDTINIDEGDLLNKFYFIDDQRHLPEYIERSIIKALFTQNHWEYSNTEKISSLLNKMPNLYVEQLVEQINHMYAQKDEKTQYVGFYEMYVAYYLPINIYKIWKPLTDLLSSNNLKRNLSILDNGSGPGSASIGLVEFYRTLAVLYPKVNFNLNLLLLDSQQEFLDFSRRVMGDIIDNLPPNIVVNIEWRKLYIESSIGFSLEKFDMITISNFLNSAEHTSDFDRKQFLINLKANLQKNGSIIIIEPADETNSIVLKELRNELYNMKEYGIFSPCIPIWQEVNQLQCKCYTICNLSWKLPEIIRFLHTKGLHKAKQKDYIPFNYLILRQDYRCKYPLEYNHSNYIYLRDIDEHIEERINIKGIVKFKWEQYKKIIICDGTNRSKNTIAFVEDKQDCNKSVLEALYKINTGERITLKNAKVINTHRGSQLLIDNKTKVMVEF